MPDLLLELFSEEIPARMQAQAAADLRKLVTGRLVDAGLVYDGAKAFVTPRRLALSVHGIPARQADLREEKKGPRVGAPENAIAGFLKAAGLKSIADAKIQSDKKGDFYVAVVERPGRAALDVLGEILPGVIKSFPWPKSMRWGVQSKEPGALDWVRPLHSIVATFGPETEEPEIVPFAVDGIAAGNATRGHRFLAPAPFTVRRLGDYMDKLDKAKVVLDAERRRDIIAAEAKQLAFAQGLELVADDGLLAEVAGLVEWPVVLMGSFDASFLQIPEEVIRATIRNNQKCFVLRDAAHAKTRQQVHPRFQHGGGGRRQGDCRRQRTRHPSAPLGREVLLRDRSEDAARGSAAEVQRTSSFTRSWAPRPSALNALNDWPRNWRHWSAPMWRRRSARRGCARPICSPKWSANSPSCRALWGNTTPRPRARTKPSPTPARITTGRRGRTILCRADPVSVAVALADKIDTLVGFWAIDEKPTGSKDPYALRRAALGVIRLILQNGLRLRLTPQFTDHRRVIAGLDPAIHASAAHDRTTKMDHRIKPGDDGTEAGDLLFFFADRLKVQLREQGARHDLVDAVFALAGQDDLLLIVRRVEALGKFLDTEDGKNLLAGYKRATNIIRIEEKKDNRPYTGAPDAGLYTQAEEKALAQAIELAKAEAERAVAAEDFAAAMRAMAKLRPHVDAFFDKVTVNVDDKTLRENRLKLLNEIRAATRAVADFSRIEG